MGDFVESASRILGQAQWRLEVVAHNIANATTTGYKRRVAFTTFEAGNLSSEQTSTNDGSWIDFAAGKVVETGASTDLAILGDGFFVVRGNDASYYTRQGQFTRESDGRLVAAGGLALQYEEGGDIVVKSSAFIVNADGMIMENGEPLGRIALVAAPGARPAEGPAGGLFSAGERMAQPLGDRSIRQGAREASNVTMGEEMLVMMEAVRRAESAQRLVNVYDDLLGRVISSLGQS